MSLRIDAHQHFWRIDSPCHEWPQRDLPTIWRDFLPEHLAPALQACRIAGSVLVQSQPSDADTDWMLGLAERTPSVLGVVGWTDVTAVGAPERIAALASHPRLKGLRPMLQNLAADWILQPSARLAIEAMAARDLVFDALIRPLHLAAIDTLAQRHPELSIVINHGAKPEIAAGGFAGWAEALSRVAERPNVACKLSGLVTEAGEGWSEAQLEPFVRHVLQVFGPDRVLWGSDWPVLLLCAGYEQWHDTACGFVPQEHEGAIFAGNAARIYSLTADECGSTGRAEPA